MAAAFVENKIRHGRVTVFVRPGCSYCRTAVALLKEFDFLPKGLKVSDITKCEGAQEYLQQRTGQRTVPCVFIGMHHLGGLSDLQTVRHELPRILREIGALR
ncbi:GLRX1 protein, partial [Podilymbus podiceps]|nr:GLRX1 protein [Podilymbus podiceps]